MITKRMFVNVIVFFVMTALLVFIGMTKFVLQGKGREVKVTFSNAQGLLPRDDVTVRGVPSGSISDVTLNDNGTTMVTINLDPGVAITQGSKAAITRRSPIGDLVVDITPGTGPELATGGSIPEKDTVQPPDPERAIEVLDRVFGSVPPSALHHLVHQLALALHNRGQDLATLSKAGADLPEKILTVRRQLESLINNGPKVLDVLASNSQTLADDLTQTAALAEILKDQRYNLVSLSQNGARFADVASQLIASEKPNLACALTDFAHINSVLATPQSIKNLVDTLDLNHFFFGGVKLLVAQSTTSPYAWFRVFFLPSQQPSANTYAKKVPPPNVYGGDACRSMYGNGVGAARQKQAPQLVKGSKIYPGH